MNKRGSNIDPWGTPHVIVLVIDLLSLIQRINKPRNLIFQNKKEYFFVSFHATLKTQSVLESLKHF